MKPIRGAMLALLTAAVMAVPISTAEAHKRHRGDAAGAFAFGLIAGAILNQGLAHRHYYPRQRYVYGGNCYGLTMPEYDACVNGAYYPRHRVAPHHYRYKKIYRPYHDVYPRYHGGGVHIIIGR